MAATKIGIQTFRRFSQVYKVALIADHRDEEATFQYVDI